MHLLVQALVERIQRKVGDRWDWARSFDRLVRLDELARAIESPPATDAAAELDAPVVVDGIRFSRLSYAAEELIRERWSLLDGADFTIAVLWTHAHARNLDALRGALGTALPYAVKMLRAWARTVHASLPAAALAVRGLRMTSTATDEEPTPKDKEKDQTGPTWGSVVSLLIERYGGTADYWTFTASVEEVSQRLIDLSIRSEAERREMAKSSRVAIAPDPDSYTARATRRYNAAATAFEKWAEASL